MDTTVRRYPVSLKITTSAPETPAPEGSNTKPRIDPVLTPLWASAWNATAPEIRMPMNKALILGFIFAPFAVNWHTTARALPSTNDHYNMFTVSSLKHGLLQG